MKIQDSNSPLRFVLVGDPTPLARMKSKKGMAWSEIKTIKRNFEASLGEQFAGRYALAVPLHLDVTFYLPLAKQPCPFKTSGCAHAQKPPLSNLVEGLLYVVDKILFESECLVVSSNQRKVYDNILRTEFEFTIVK